LKERLNGSEEKNKKNKKNPLGKRKRKVKSQKETELNQEISWISIKDIMIFFGKGFN